MNAVVQLQPQGGSLAAHSSGHRAVAEIIEHVATVQQVMKAVMKPDVHYGVIPGTDKPTLLKAGAELLCMTFRIADKYEVEDLSTADTVRYRVTCHGIHQTTGTVLGTGMGEASSGEEKYKWIKATKAEWEGTPETQRRKKHGYNRKERREFEILQVRTEPANLANTVLKMANKRAKLAMVLNVTAASDMFTQDLEDMEDRLREHLSEEDTADQQEAAQSAAPQASALQPADTDEAFEKRLPIYRGYLAAGKTHDDIVAFIKSKRELTPEQEKKVRALTAADAKQAQDVEPKVTFAHVADKIARAETVDQVAEAEDLIGSVDDSQQRVELQNKAAARREELGT